MGSTWQTSGACFRSTQHPHSCTGVGRGHTEFPWAQRQVVARRGFHLCIS
uniref:Uncharacterized protein n=1 Tax=Anguilla anguilla TaxID=7936 RepID=A0A0E9V4V7_ANGAN